MAAGCRIGAMIKVIDYGVNVIDVTFNNATYLAEFSAHCAILLLWEDDMSLVLLGLALNGCFAALRSQWFSCKGCVWKFLLTLHTNDRMSTKMQPPSYEIRRQHTPTHSAPRVCVLAENILMPPHCQYKLLPLGFCLSHTEWTTDRHRALFLPQAIQLLN